MRLLHRHLVTVCFVPLLVGACASERCGNNQEQVNGECRSPSENKSVDSGTKDVEAEPEEEWDPAFGQECTDDEDCGDVATFCTDPTGQGKYCTRKLANCDDADSLCPQFWGCVDLSGFNRHLKPVCTRP